MVSEPGWDGHDLLAALRHAAAMLHSQLDEVNALNVFPVPDGDTGSNMLATIQAAIAEAESVPRLERSVTRIAAAISLGALMGARGNSGVILSQLLRGIGDSITGSERVHGVDLARAFERGCATAFAAVANPVEGTMLTVARDVANAALGVADDGIPPALEDVLRIAVAEAASSVARTPDLLPVLSAAGVVDAGGRGLELLLRGVLASIRDDRLPHGMNLPHDIPIPTWDALEAEGHGYETVFVVLPPEGDRLDVTLIRSRLEQLGDSVLIAGDERAVKIHVHSERPDEVVAFGLTIGSLSRISIENLDRQATDVRERARVSAERSDADLPAAPRRGPAVVAVAPGDGWAHVLTTLGATAVVQGGQGANPSVGELADAIRATNEREVIVLPNNPNVRLAARHAGDLVPGTVVHVLPTRNPGEGVAALLAFDPDQDAKDAARLMTEAARRVHTFEVTLAVRDARIGHRKVARGDYMVLGADDALIAADVDRLDAIRQAVATLDHGVELLTLYRGRDVEHAVAQHVRDALSAELDGIEVELVDGGQPHYDFLIAAE
jgi:DAK2 domain fusion protein YloV